MRLSQSDVLNETTCAAEDQSAQDPGLLILLMMQPVRTLFVVMTVCHNILQDPKCFKYGSDVTLLRESYHDVTVAGPPMDSAKEPQQDKGPAKGSASVR